MQIPVFVAVPAGGESQIGMSILEVVDFALSLWKVKTESAHAHFLFSCFGYNLRSCFGGFG